MENKFKYLIILSVGIISLLTGCKKDSETEYSSAYPICGDWYVNEYTMDGELVWGPYFLSVYNTSYSPDSIWIDNIYDSGVKVKAAKTGNNIFGVTGSPDINETEIPISATDVLVVTTVDITEAKVVGTDSIYFVVTLYDADNAIIDQYVEAGIRKTGFE